MAPLWMRGLAFAIDGAALAMLVYLPWRLAPDAAMLFAPYAVWLQAAAAFAYFALANGPVGKGATIGKAILDLQTVDRNGQPLQAPAAFKRAALQLAPFLLMIAASQFLRPDPFSVSASALYVVPFYAGLALLGGCVAHLVAHPLNQGWHDALAGSYTARKPIGALFENLQDAADSQRREIASKTLQMGLLAAAAVAGLGSCDNSLMRARAVAANPEFARNERYTTDAFEAGAVDGVRPRFAGLPEFSEQLRAGKAPEGITTTTLLLAYPFVRSAPKDASERALEGAKRLLASLSEDSELGQQLIFRQRDPRAQSKQPGPGILRTDVQIARVEVVVYEVMPMFGFEGMLLREVGERASAPALFPPDDLVKPMAKEDAAAPDAKSSDDEAEATAATTEVAEVAPEEEKAVEQEPTAASAAAEKDVQGEPESVPSGE